MKYNVLLALPSSGRPLEQSLKSRDRCSKNHNITKMPSMLSGPNFNNCWAQGLAAMRNGTHSKMAMMHEDIEVLEDHADFWIDILSDEQDRLGVDFIAAAVVIKDHRALMDVGVGDPEDDWKCWRRFTLHEMPKLPKTFTAEDIGYGDKYLLFNFGLCLFDLRNPRWHQKDDAGYLKIDFNFVERIFDANHTLRVDKRGEDYRFAQCMWKCGLTAAVTQHIRTRHWEGRYPFDSFGDWGLWKHDEETAYKWQSSDPLAEKEVAHVAN